MKTFLHLACVLLCAVIFAGNAYGQSPNVKFEAGSTTGSIGDVVTSQVTFENFASPLSVQFNIEWDPTVLQYDRISGVNAQITSSEIDSSFVSSGRITFIYSSNPVITFGSVFDAFDLSFELIDDGAVSVDLGGTIEFIGADGMPRTLGSDPWSVTVGNGGGTSTPCTGATGQTVVFGDATVMSGNSECVTVYGANLNPFSSFSLGLDYDGALLGNVAIRNVNALFTDPADLLTIDSTMGPGVSRGLASTT